jgi:hypothetical protein
LSHITHIALSTSTNKLAGTLLPFTNVFKSVSPAESMTVSDLRCLGRPNIQDMKNLGTYFDMHNALVPSFPHGATNNRL